MSEKLYHCLHDPPPAYRYLNPDHLSHNSSSSGPCPDAIPIILAPLRAWLRKRVSIRTVSTELWKSVGRRNILSKCSRQRFLTAHFLPTNEAVHRDCNSTVNILRGAVFRKTHLAEGFADTHDGFEMTNLEGACQ